LRSQNPSEKFRFIADQMLGRLAKWLRLLGYDTLYLNPAPDGKLIEIAKEQNRVLLTRDTHLMERRPIKKGIVRAVLIRDDAWEKQLAQLVSEFGLSPRKFRDSPFCGECNSLIQEISKEKVKEKVPLYVYQTHDYFSTCPNCGRYYWEGTHWERINEKLGSIFGEFSQASSKD